MGGCQSSINVKATAAANNDNAESKSKRTSSGNFAGLASKFTSGGAAASLAEARELHQIPGRLFSNGASRITSLCTRQGKKGINQDAMLVWENFRTGRDRNATFCGVFDGHGPFGHMVAARVRDILPILLRLQWEIKLQNDQSFVDENDNYQGIRRLDAFMDDIDDNDNDNDSDDDDCESMKSEDTEVVPETHMVLKNSILKASKLMDKELKSHPAIDCFCSGTTAVILVAEDLIIGNVGDSRAVLATRDNNNALAAIQLTVDLKPDLPREAARIQKRRGRVFALQDEPKVARLWLPNSNSPGLAMARAFGDFCLKDFGLISVPDVHYHRVTDRDEFIILATDGVWDVLSNQEAADIVASAPSRGTASRVLIDSATRAWRFKYPTSKIDDCAAVCLFLDNTSRSECPKAQNDPINAPKDNTPNDEIVPVVEEPEKPMVGRSMSSRQSLANYLSNDDNEWSALEGVTRVNSLINLPRFMPSIRRSKSRRKWL